MCLVFADKKECLDKSQILPQVAVALVSGHAQACDCFAERL